MSITTYAELQTAIGNWLDHSLFTARIPEFIALFEACANRRLRVRQQEATTNLTPDANGSASLPADYLALRRVTWTGSPRVELAYVHPSYLQAAYPSAPADVPRIFTIEGATLKVRPRDQTALEVNYFQKIPALATTDPNWLLTAHPDLYLFGALVEAEMFGVNDERAPMWKARRDEIFDEIDKLNNKTRGGDPGAARVMGTTP
jgi:hypothetical protein